MMWAEGMSELLIALSEYAVGREIKLGESLADVAAEIRAKAAAEREGKQ